MVKTKNNLIPQGRILNATISQEPNGHYYCSLCCTNIEFSQYERTGKTVGIDLGIVDFAIFSDGIKIENPRFYEKSEKKLAKLQRELSRKTIGSSNWNKTRIKVANLQKHISNQRNDFLHKLTTDIVRQYDVICLEDLDVKSMKETDSKTRNKHMNDVSLSEFRRQITYKSQWCGKVISVIDRYYPSSQICHICGHRDGKKSVDIRKWICPNCHSELDRDENAAINIENEGLRVLEMT
jgi:putative transposase